MSEYPATPEAVALKLLHMVMDAENRGTNDNLIEQNRQTRLDRKYLLDTYTECLTAVLQPRSRDDDSELAERLRRARERVAAANA